MLKSNEDKDDSVFPNSPKMLKVDLVAFGAKKNRFRGSS